MKIKSLYAMLVVALVAMTSCSDNEDNTVREAQDA